jgi:hypothetical protein
MISSFLAFGVSAITAVVLVAVLLVALDVASSEVVVVFVVSGIVCTNTRSFVCVCVDVVDEGGCDRGFAMASFGHRIMAMFEA